MHKYSNETTTILLLRITLIFIFILILIVFYFPDLRNKNENLTTDERIALEIYEAMRSKKGKQNVEDSDEENEGLPEPMDEDNGAGKEPKKSYTLITGLMIKPNEYETDPYSKTWQLIVCLVLCFSPCSYLNLPVLCQKLLF